MLSCNNDDYECFVQSQSHGFDPSFGVYPCLAFNRWAGTVNPCAEATAERHEPLFSCLVFRHGGLLAVVTRCFKAVVLSPIGNISCSDCMASNHNLPHTRGILHDIDLARLSRANAAKSKWLDRIGRSECPLFNSHNNPYLLELPSFALSD